MACLMVADGDGGRHETEAGLDRDAVEDLRRSDGAGGLADDDVEGAPRPSNPGDRAPRGPAYPAQAVPHLREGQTADCLSDLGGGVGGGAGSSRKREYGDGRSRLAFGTTSNGGRRSVAIQPAERISRAI